MQLSENALLYPSYIPADGHYRAQNMVRQKYYSILGSYELKH